METNTQGAGAEGGGSGSGAGAEQAGAGGVDARGAGEQGARGDGTGKVDLQAAILRAHALSARRESLSREAVRAAAVGSGRYEQAIAAALMTLGGLHGPARQCAEMLDESWPHPRAVAEVAMKMGIRIPGWGCSFIKEPDPDWSEVHAILEAEDSLWWGRAMQVQKCLHDAGKMIYLNPAGYTALGALSLGVPACAASFLIIAGRLPEWTAIFIRESETAPTLWESQPQS